MVEGQGFQRLSFSSHSLCEISSKDELEKTITKIYEASRESVAASLGSIKSELALMIEEWRSYSSEKYITISVCYQNIGEATIEYKVLNTLHAPSDWRESHWGSAIDSLLFRYNMKIDKITAAVVGTSIIRLHNALKKRFIIVPCLLANIQVCAHVCFENPEVAQVLSKCRSVIGTITNHLAVSTGSITQEQSLEMQKIAMLDYSTVWMSTYNMLEQMLSQCYIVMTILKSMEGIDQEMFEITNDQWKVIKDVVNVFEPLKEIIMTLSEEKVPAISLLKPLLVPLHLKESDSDTVKSLKESLSNMVYEQYTDDNVTLLLQIATFLDPRFKSSSYVTEEDKSKVISLIKEMLTKLIEEESRDSISAKTDIVQSKKRIERLLSDLYVTEPAEIPAKEKADLEVVLYQLESVAPLDSCPLQWWSKVSAKCPNLAKLASRYHCVPAFCVPPTRIPTDIQIQYNTNRAALPPHLIDKLLFLHGNHTMQV